MWLVGKTLCLLGSGWSLIEALHQKETRNLLNFKKIWLLKFYFLEITDAKNVKKVIILIITISTITTTMIITMVTIYCILSADSAVCLALGIKLWVSRYGPCPLTRGSQPWLHSRFTREPLKNSNAQASHFSDSDLIILGWDSGVDIFTKFSVNFVQPELKMTCVVEDLSM